MCIASCLRCSHVGDLPRSRPLCDGLAPEEPSSGRLRLAGGTLTPVSLRHTGQGLFNVLATSHPRRLATSLARHAFAHDRERIRLTSATRTPWRATHDRRHALTAGVGDQRHVVGVTTHLDREGKEGATDRPLPLQPSSLPRPSDVRSCSSVLAAATRRAA